MNIKSILEKQAQLQESMGNPMGTGERGVKENMLALMVEAVETLNETNWKPWKQTAKEVDRIKLLTEHTDILQFWANSVLAAGFTAKEVENALSNKWKINDERVKDGY